MSFLAPSPCAATARTGLISARGLQAGRQKPLARVRAGHRRGISQGGKAGRRLLFISQEQEMRPSHRTGRRMAFLEKGIEQPTLGRTQLHDICLGHDSRLSDGECTQDHRRQKSR